MSSIVSDNPAKNATNEAFGTTHQRLFYLHDLPDFKVHHDDPDVRGWKLKLDSGDVIGTVDNLIVDKALRKVRYLEIKTEEAFATTYRDRATYLDRDFHDGRKAGVDELVIVPVGMIRLDYDSKTCVASGVTADYFGQAPRYRRGSTLRPRYEIETLHYYDNEHPTFKGNKGDADYSPFDRTDYSPFDRTAYRDFDEDRFQGMHDRFYEHRMFNTDSYYNRHAQAQAPASL